MMAFVLESQFFKFNGLFDFCFPQPRQEPVCWALAGISWIGIPGAWGELLLALKLQSKVESSISEAVSQGKSEIKTKLTCVYLNLQSNRTWKKEGSQEVGAKGLRQRKEAE